MDPDADRSFHRRPLKRPGELATLHGVRQAPVPGVHCQRVLMGPGHRAGVRGSLLPRLWPIWRRTTTATRCNRPDSDSISANFAIIPVSQFGKTWLMTRISAFGSAFAGTLDFVLGRVRTDLHIIPACASTLDLCTKPHVVSYVGINRWPAGGGLSPGFAERFTRLTPKRRETVLYASRKPLWNSYRSRSIAPRPHVSPILFFSFPAGRAVASLAVFRMFLLGWPGALGDCFYTPRKPYYGKCLEGTCHRTSEFSVRCFRDSFI